jgi:hypothetical protein
MTDHTLIVVHDRLSARDRKPVAALSVQRAARAIKAGLTYLPDARDMASILRHRLDLPERIWLTASGMWSLPPDIAEQFVEATRLDIFTCRNGPVAAEAERQRRRWGGR